MLHPALRALERCFAPSSLNQIHDPCLEQAGVELWLKRDDLLHPVISGNKWRKLKYILDDALNRQAKTLVSMGGPWSNHLHALAYTGKQLGLKTRAFIRGEEPARYSPTLRDIQNWGMQCQFITRSEYRTLRHYQKPDSLPGLQKGEYWIPEGGAMELALQGVHQCVTEIPLHYDCLCVSVGTGTTLAGLIQASPEHSRVLGVVALKGGDYLAADIDKLVSGNASANWALALDYHAGGFARTTPVLEAFIQRFETRQQIPLDSVYNGKLLYALYDLIQQGYFKRGQRIIAIHTGGLQGKRDFIQD